MMPVPPKIWKAFLKKMELKPGGAAHRPTRTERLPVKINRDPKLVLHPFTDYFQGFEDALPVKALFGKGTENALQALRVEFLESPFGSIFPSEEEDGHMVVNTRFVEEADVESIYLDVILCLNFVRRVAAAGAASLGSEQAEFGESPHVLESYKAMVKEARRIGTPDAKVMERLRLPEFMMSDAAFKRFVRALGLKPVK
jgi:hypothetical protein